MSALKFEDFKNISEKATIQEVEKAIKATRGFETYEEEIKKGRKDTSKGLEIAFMLESLVDEELRLLVQMTAQQLLFSMLDTKFRSEILGESEGK